MSDYSLARVTVVVEHFVTTAGRELGERLQPYLRDDVEDEVSDEIAAALIEAFAASQAPGGTVSNAIIGGE